jgi:hypothetical protein
VVLCGYLGTTSCWLRLAQCLPTQHHTAVLAPSCCSGPLVPNERDRVSSSAHWGLSAHLRDHPSPEGALLTCAAKRVKPNEMGGQTETPLVFALGAVVGGLVVYGVLTSRARQAGLGRGADDDEEEGERGTGGTGHLGAALRDDIEYKMVLCVRNDLKMGKGKIGAQCRSTGFAARAPWLVALLCAVRVGRVEWRLNSLSRLSGFRV